MDEEKKASAEAPNPSEALLDAGGGDSGGDSVAESGADNSSTKEATSVDDVTAASPSPEAVAAIAHDSPVPTPSPVEMKAEGGLAPSPGVNGPVAKRVYQAGKMRKTLLSFVFLLLLPFFASLPAMVYQRVTHQLWGDMLGFAIFALGFAFIMLVVVFELMHSIRARVEFDEGAVRLTLPAARGVSMPKLFYRKKEIPYSEIELVETRREVYGGTLAPVMLRGARIVTKTGDKVPLGYVSEANVDPVLPVPEIASEIARRAGTEVMDRGTVRRAVNKKLRGIKAAEAAAEIAEAEIEALNRRHNNLMLALCSVLFLLVAGGLLLDISRSNLDFGERAQQLVQQTAKPSPQAKKQ